MDEELWPEMLIETINVESELELRFSDYSAVFFHFVSIKDSKEQELANRIKDTKALYMPESYPAPLRGVRCQV